MKFDWSRYAPQPWRSQVTPHVVPILIQRAKQQRTITYTELAEELERRYGLEPVARKTLYGQPAGAVGYALIDLGKKWGERIPPLNAILVNQRGGLPGKGADWFVLRYLKKRRSSEDLAPDERRHLMELAIDQVKQYPAQLWDRVAADLGAPTLPHDPEFDDVEPIELPKVSEPRGGESREHKALKHWVCAHPEALAKFGRFGPGETERLIGSGDRLDVYFENSRAGALAIEVKASHASNAELVRGVFQAVKYRAVLAAERIARGEMPMARAILVTTRQLDERTMRLCARLKVPYRVLPRSAERG